MRLLRHPHFLAVALSHWMIDMLGAQTGILLAVLSEPLGLTNAAIGLIATAYTCVSSLAQPLFGWLADRYGSRWPMIVGVLWMGFFFSLVAVTPGSWPLVCLVIGGLGSAAFHPSGTSRALHLGHRRMAGQVATATSLFILFGQGGLSIGPALGGFLIDHLGRPGLLGLTVLAVPIALFTAWQIRPEPRPLPGHAASHEASHDSPTATPDLATFALIMLLAGLRLWAQSAVNTFAPKYFHDLGLSPSVYGVIVALFMGGAAIGGVIGGMLSDRWNRRWTITLTLALSVLPLYLLPVVQSGWIFPLALVAGLLSGAPHSIFIAMAQRSLPGRAALAAGITLGFMFASGAAGAYLSGLAADQFGLSPALQANAALAALAAVLSLWLRPDSPRLRPEPMPAAAES
jgi:MFS transporter, FSR family, fosmidomycin resistance protein